MGESKPHTRFTDGLLAICVLVLLAAVLTGLINVMGRPLLEAYYYLESQTHQACSACVGACWSHSKNVETVPDAGVYELPEYQVAHCTTHVCTCINKKDQLLEIEWPEPVGKAELRAGQN
jgi:hypothetical protein